jgi:hypothetical protein
MTGLVASSIVWSEVLVEIFGVTVSGVDCVLKSDRNTYTYHIQDGVAFLR